MSNMRLEDALKVAEIFEADDIISVPAMACRILGKTVKDLTEQIVDLRLEVAAFRDQTGD
jgi:hypothetical protein